MRVVVFGASGVQGRAQVSALVQAKHHPVAVSRSPKTVQFHRQEVETFAADFSDASAIRQSLQDAEAIFLNLPSTSFQPAEPVIDAARTVGEAAKRTPSIRLIIFNTSMPVPEIPQNIEAQDHRRQIRDMLRSMDLPVISIQPVVFLENLLEGWAWPPIRDQNLIRYCHKPTLDVSWISLDDVARLMIAAIERPELAGRNFAVGGPETVQLHELTDKLARAWKRPLAYEYQTVQDFAYKIGEAMKDRAHIAPEVLVDQMFRAYTWYNDNNGFKVDMEPTLKELPATLTPIEEWARNHDPFNPR